VEWQWLIARASGFTAYVLVTLAVVFGLLLSQRWQSRRVWPRIINDQLHQYTTLLAGVFTAIHGISVWIDPFTSFTLKEVLVPGVSHYRPIFMAFGIVSAYLGLAVVITGWLRPKIGYPWWRRLHYLTFVVWLFATLHGLGNGSDTRTSWAIAIYGVSIAAVVGLTITRLLRPAGRPRVAPRPGWATLAAALALGVAGFAALGPLRPGWNTVANSGHGSGGRVSVPAETVSLTAPYSATFAGTVTEQGPNAQGVATLVFQLQLQGGPYDAMTLELQGQGLSGGGVTLTGSSVSFGTTSDPTMFRGTLVQLNGGDFEAVVRGSSGTYTLIGQISLVGQTGVQGILQVESGAARGGFGQGGGDDGGFGQGGESGN
jgi:hypothetical protein